MKKPVKLAWINQLLAPIWFLFVIVLFSVYFGAKGVAETEIPLKLSQNIPTLILIVQLIILATLYFTAKKENFHLLKEGWKTENKRLLVTDTVYGIATGLVLALAYIYALSPLQNYLQTQVGDYVPAGETLKSLGSQNMRFFVANVVLAPFVEESLYRNYGLTRFVNAYGVKRSVILSSVLFGLLHWTGGVWYILLTCIFIGVPFALIAIKRQNILWVFAAHLTLNLAEYLYISQ